MLINTDAFFIKCRKGANTFESRNRKYVFKNESEALCEGMTPVIRECD